MFVTFCTLRACHRVSACMLIFVVVIPGCGGGGFDRNKVTVTVSPAAVTIPPNGEVTLQATVRGTDNDPAQPVNWSIKELQTNGSSGAQCNWWDTPPVDPCPFGTIQLTVAPGRTATYHAPSSTGTFHVVVEWGGFLDPAKDATATITVAP